MFCKCWWSSNSVIFHKSWLVLLIFANLICSFWSLNLVFQGLLFKNCKCRTRLKAILRKQKISTSSEQCIGKLHSIQFQQWTHNQFSLQICSVDLSVRAIWKNISSLAKIDNYYLVSRPCHFNHDILQETKVF